ncbi:MAG: hypothetical protein HKN25_17490 [Pyrinomonadaceae bacterium]|nr:hypothetical protein [Pyrinomonadaceae bacterium]
MPKVSNLHFSCLSANLIRRSAGTLLAIFVLIVTHASVFSQDDPIDEALLENLFGSTENLHQWGAINSFHGLPSERVNGIAQTEDGFLWFGTDNGLAKFDGRRVQTITTSALSSLRIFALKTDLDDNLWIGTENGAFYYSGTSFEPIDETSDRAINSIYIDENAVYLTDSKGSVFRATKDENEFEATAVFSKSLPLKSISEFNGEVIVGTFNGGLMKLEDGEAKPIISRPRPFFINVLARDSEGKLWLGARSSLGNSGLFVSEKMPVLKILGGNLGTVNSISFGDSKSAWVGTDERGAFSFEAEGFRKRFTFENTSGGLRSNRILSTFIDREGVVWFGTDKGVSRYDPKSPVNERVSTDSESNFVRTLFKTKDGKIYAGTNRGLFIHDESSNSWRPEKELATTTIYSIEEGEKGDLLVGTPKGFFLLSSDTESIAKNPVIEDANIRAIEHFQEKTYLAYFDQGLKRLRVEDRAILNEQNILSLHNEIDKNLWIGTVDRGVFIYDGKNDAIQRPELETLKNSAIRAIAGDETDGIWFATAKGLFLFKDNTLQLILDQQNVRSVLVEKSKDAQPGVWCAAENGLFHLIFDENFGWINSRIDIEQGLSSQNIFSILSVENDSFLVGTNRGIVRYTSSDIRPLVVPSRILSQRVHRLSELKTGIKIDYPQNSLSVEVSAISSRTFPEQFRYSFLLFDGKGELIDKRFSNDPQFLMDKLLPDNYKVEIRAYDKNLVSSQPLIFNVEVEQAPFPLIATILGVLLLIALAALIWAIFSQQKIIQTSKQLETANLELNAARLDLANEAERERHRISRDLHDQTLADLRHLLLMADEVESEKAPLFRTEIENVSDEIRRICEDLSPSVLENIGFTASLEWALNSAVEQVSSKDEIKHSFVCEENLEEHISLTRPEQIQIYRIAQEVLSNIVRHSNASEIEMTAGKDSSGFVLKVKDDGKMFDPDTSKTGRGLANIDARAKLIEAEIGWKRGENKGMIFTLKK